MSAIQILAQFDFKRIHGWAVSESKDFVHALHIKAVYQISSVSEVVCVQSGLKRSAESHSAEDEVVVCS